MSNSIYSDKLRVRVLGLLNQNDELLLIKLHSPISNQDIWTPPGGGVNFGETLHSALIREFKEETGLEIEVKELVRINELIEPPFHAIEFYFKVERISGDLKLGFDPEHGKDNQILKDIAFFKKSDIPKILVKPDFIKSYEEFSEGSVVFHNKE